MLSERYNNHSLLLSTILSPSWSHTWERSLQVFPFDLHQGRFCRLNDFRFHAFLAKIDLLHRLISRSARHVRIIKILALVVALDSTLDEDGPTWGRR